ncbi:MAG: flippase activity-associated protein Agl23, partial [Dehalococcoidia bacterium]
MAETGSTADALPAPGARGAAPWPSGAAGRWEDGRWVEAPPAAAPAAGPLLVVEDEPEAPSRAGWRPGLPLRWEVGAYFTLALIAALMRFWDLGGRAVHHDESLHGYYAWLLYTGKGFVHNPLMHGPFQFHLDAASFFLLGDSDFSLRAPSALFGVGLVLMPWLLRRRLGNVGALIVAAMLAFSPSMLYFSRFARNDLFMAVWTLGLLVMIWRYLDEGKPRYLYIAAALVALGFVTKETQYITVTVMAVPLLLMGWPDIGGWLWGRRRLSEAGRAASMFLLLATLTLPLVGAMISLLQDPLGVVLATRTGGGGVATGAPDGTGIAVATGLTVALLVMSAVIGLAWNARVWLRSFLIFAAIFVFFYTTVFTEWGGVGSGIWQGLGYWIAQQDVARGGQPEFYYLMLTGVYEFLPATIALGAGLYYAFRGDTFTRFLVFWAAATFLGYTAAGEKMPWLEVHVALPLILLAGKALGDVVAAVPWRRTVSRGGLWVLLGVPVFLLALWRLLFLGTYNPAISGGDRFLALWGLFTVLGLLLLLLWALARRIGARPVWSMVLVTLAGMMAVLTLKAGWVASFVYSDVPQEMLVYTQTSPQLADLVDEVRTASRLTGDGASMPIIVDTSSAFSWPWTWYLRDYDRVSYPGYSALASPPEAPPDAAVVIIHSDNKFRVGDTFGDDFTPVDQLISWDAGGYDNQQFCGEDTYGLVNAGYCYLDNTIGWDRGQLLPSLRDSFGDVAVANVLAHEYGHAIQHQAKLNSKDTPTLVAEQQADCFAGAY